MNRRSILDILVKATDKASGVINGIASKAGGSLDKVADKMDRVGQKMTLGITTPFLALTGVAANAASDLNESVNAINVVFGEGAEKVLAYGKTAAESAGLSNRAFNQLVTPIGAMLKNVGFGADQAADSSITLAQRAADMASVFNTDVASALGAIQAGLRGEIDPLERFGVSLKASAVEAHAMELGLADSNGELSEAALAHARVSLLMEQTNSIAGDFANTAGEAANQERIMAAEAENAAAKLGQKLLPIKQKLVEILSKAIDAWSSLPEPVKDAVLVFGALAAAAGPVLFYASKLIGTVKALSGVFTALNGSGGLVVKIAPKIGAAMTLMMGPIGLVVAAVGLLAAAFATDFLGIRSATEDAVDDMAMNFGSMGDTVHRLADESGVSFQSMKDEIKAAMEETGNSFEQTVERIDAGLGAIGPALESSSSAAHAWSDEQKAAYASAMGGMVSEIEQGVDGAAEEFGTLPGESADAILANQQELADAGKQLVDFMNEALDPAQEAARIRGFLTSQELAQGLDSGNPLVVQKAKELKAAAEARLAELNGYTHGASFATEFALGISENQWRAQSAAAGMAQVTRSVMPSSEPKDPRSPFRGITKAWGFMDTLARGLRVGADRPAKAVARAMELARRELHMEPTLAFASAGGGFSGGGRPRGGGGVGGPSTGPIVHIEHFTGTETESERLARQIERRLGRR